MGRYREEERTHPMTMTFTTSAPVIDQPIRSPEDVQTLLENAVLETSSKGANALIPSWSVIRQTTAVGDATASIEVARIAGRRMVEQHGAALERLADE